MYISYQALVADDIPSQFLLTFFRPIFKCYLLWSLLTDWLQILWSLKSMAIMPIEHFCNCFFICSAQFSNFLKILGRLTSNYINFLKILGCLTSNVMWGILGRVSTKVMEIMLMQQFLSAGCQSPWASCLGYVYHKLVTILQITGHSLIM